MERAPCRGLGSVVHPDFIEYMNHVTLDCVLRDFKLSGYFPIRGPSDDSLEHLEFPFRKRRR